MKYPLRDKLERLKDGLVPVKSALLAYSGGVDSSLLLRVAHEIMGDRLLAVTVRTMLQYEKEADDAQSYAAVLGARHLLVEMDMLNEKFIADNPRDRCFGCKKLIFTRLTGIARESGIEKVIEGSNADDPMSYRPGIRALEELGIESPLKNAGLTKKEIRELARRLAVPAWDRPARPCLATRFPYDTTITPEKLNQVKEAEAYLAMLGFREYRVRHHGEIARIEAGQAEIKKLRDAGTTGKITAEFKKLGFRYVALDLEGFRSGSMDESV